MEDSGSSEAMTKILHEKFLPDLKDIHGPSDSLCRIRWSMDIAGFNMLGLGKEQVKARFAQALSKTIANGVAILYALIIYLPVQDR